MYKIIKEIHTYNGKIIFRVLEKSMWGFTDIGEEFISFGAAEEYVIKELDQKHGGIIKIDNNVYTFLSIFFISPMKTDSQLPYPLKIAAGATQLDNIKIIITDKKISTRRVFFFLRIGDWESRLVKRAVSHLNEDIRGSLIRYKNPEIHIYEIAHVTENPIFATLQMKYIIK